MRLSEAQIVRRNAVLRDVERSGGRDSWDHLHSHGHRYGVVYGCICRGELAEQEGSKYRYHITFSGRRALQGRD